MTRLLAIAALLLALVCSHTLGDTTGESLDKELDFLRGRVNLLTQAVNQFSADRYKYYWEAWGCKPNDEHFDNGPFLSAILATNTGYVPTAGADDYYVSSTVKWPKRNGGALLGAGGYTAFLQTPSVGVTRLLWNGPPGLPMIEGPISGGRISQMVIQGGLKGGGLPRAGVGIKLLNEGGPPTGFMTLDQVSYCNMDVGFLVANEPIKLYGNYITHSNCIWHGVATNYWVQGEDNAQSTMHRFYGCQHKAGYKIIYRFDSGAPLRSRDCYIGGNSNYLPKDQQNETGDKVEVATLLRVGRGSGEYEITGAKFDGNAKNLCFVEHGKYPGHTRISGEFAPSARIYRDKSSAMAEPLVLDRKDYQGPIYGSVKIDCTSGVQWPVEAK